mmetsp:Transcript_45194/g.110045  ORF Transcript_45194/g.110045 Transcript_45194/m.110045 type:complete len:219 (-) Transcript_45194:595-1251(-)
MPFWSPLSFCVFSRPSCRPTWSCFSTCSMLSSTILRTFSRSVPSRCSTTTLSPSVCSHDLLFAFPVASAPSSSRSPPCTDFAGLSCTCSSVTDEALLRAVPKLPAASPRPRSFCAEGGFDARWDTTGEPAPSSSANRARRSLRAPLAECAVSPGLASTPLVPRGEVTGEVFSLALPPFGRIAFAGAILPSTCREKPAKAVCPAIVSSTPGMMSQTASR